MLTQWLILAWLKGRKPFNEQLPLFFVFGFAEYHLEYCALHRSLYNLMDL